MKKYEQDKVGTGGVVRTNSEVAFSNKHMDTSVLADQQKLIFTSSVRKLVTI